MDKLIIHFEGLGSRAVCNLLRAGLSSVVDFTTKTESDLRKIPDVGSRTINEIKEELSRLGLTLLPEIEEKPLNKHPSLSTQDVYFKARREHAFWLRLVDGLSYDEIGLRLGVGGTQCKNHVYRIARDFMRQEFGRQSWWTTGMPLFDDMTVAARHKRAQRRKAEQSAWETERTE